MGDNRAVSIDSRYEQVGFIPFDEIVGKAVFKVLPLGSFGRIGNPYKE